ncbi:GDSL family lipase [Bacillus mangrovi]|uniref:GDSL family lipase n=1 Tax=Metabacillus mangrovi TaxID=1491830 RepID=A0A7X2S6M3_9BACI|nr:SGNH/GDSL hydrolase family protein [Metabacillus mangrovi]MTH54634.1 GDSL family lipase [Metabacillus mangrovi]
MRSVKIITVLSLAACLLWAGSLVYAVNSQLFGGEGPPPVKPPAGDIAEPLSKEGEYKVVGLGDSLTKGIGDEDGKGYAGYALDELKKKTEQEIQFTNLAVGGFTSAQLEEQLQQPEIRRQVSQADSIIMTIGGNDLFAGGEVMNNLSADAVKETRTGFLSRLGNIFKQIQAVNPEAQVFYVGLYNPFNDLSSSKVTSGIVREWNFFAAEEAAKYKNTVSVPTYDLFEQNVNDYLYDDKFHPNAEGYKLIGERLSSLITFSREGDQQ